MKKTIKKKISRKDLLKKEDEFITGSMKFLKWLQEHYNKVLISGIIAFVILAVVFSMNYRYKSNLKKSENFLALAKRTYYGKVRLPSDDPNIPLGPLEFATYSEKYQKALDLFEQVVQLYPKTEAAENAMFFIANCFHFLKKYDQAIEAFRNYLNQYPNGIYALQARIGIGDAQIAKEDYESAIVTFRQILDYNQDYELLDIIYIRVGNCYEKIGSFDKAKESYQHVVINFPESSFLKDVEEMIDKLEGKV